MLNEAQSYELHGDEEHTYVFYMKYFGLIKEIQNHRDYKKEKDFVNKLLGTKSDIKKRFDIAANIKDHLIERYKKQNQIKLASINMDKNDYQNDVTSNEIKTAIHCEELFGLMIDRNAKILIIDCRYREEFQASCLEYKNHFNIPAESIRHGYVKNLIAKIE